MIGSEFARAKNLLRDGVNDEVAQCYERAFELLDLCAMDPQWRPRLTPAERWRETGRLWSFYITVGGSLDPEPDSESPFDTVRTQGSRPSYRRTD